MVVKSTWLLHKEQFRFLLNAPNSRKYTRGHLDIMTQNANKTPILNTLCFSELQQKSRKCLPSGCFTLRRHLKISIWYFPLSRVVQYTLLYPIYVGRAVCTALPTMFMKEWVSEWVTVRNTQVRSACIIHIVVTRTWNNQAFIYFFQLMVWKEIWIIYVRVIVLLQPYLHSFPRLSLNPSCFEEVLPSFLSMLLWG